MATKNADLSEWVDIDDREVNEPASLPHVRVGNPLAPVPTDTIEPPLGWLSGRAENESSPSVDEASDEDVRQAIEAGEQRRSSSNNGHSSSPPECHDGEGGEEALAGGQTEGPKCRVPGCETRAPSEGAFCESCAALTSLSGTAVPTLRDGRSARGRRAR